MNEEKTLKDLKQDKFLLGKQIGSLLLEFEKEYSCTVSLNISRVYADFNKIVSVHVEADVKI